MFKLRYSLFVTVSPPLPPPPSGEMDDSRFSLLPAPFDARYNTNVDSMVDYGGNYAGDYNSRRSRLEEEEEDWIPENYIEKGENRGAKFASETAECRMLNCKIEAHL